MGVSAFVCSPLDVLNELYHRNPKIPRGETEYFGVTIGELLKWGGENMSTRKRKRPVSKKKQAHNVKMSKQDMEAYRDIANKIYQGRHSRDSHY